MFGITNVQRIASTYNSGDYAYINCLYPVGSTVTCGNGSYIRAAADNIGAVIFGVPEAGSWTVTCTDGTKTVNKTVEIVSSGQIEIVKIGYETYLIEDGFPHVTFTMYGATQTTGNASLNDLYHYRFTGTYDGGGCRGFTKDAITVGLNTKVVWNRTARVNVLGQLRIWNGTTSNPTLGNTLAYVQISAGATSVELDIPSGYSTIKVGLSLAYNQALSTRNLYLI